MAVQFIRRASDVAPRSSIVREVPAPGARLTAARARLVAAEAAWIPYEAEHLMLTTQRDEVLNEIAALEVRQKDGLGVADRMRAEVLRRERGVLNDRMARFCEDRDLPGGERFVAYTEWRVALAEVSDLEGQIAQCRAKITDLQKQLAPVLADLFALTGEGV